jgi:hypothetical protein
VSIKGPSFLGGEQALANVFHICEYLLGWNATPAFFLGGDYNTTTHGCLKRGFSHLRKYDTLLLRRKPGERKMGIYGVTENESAISDIGNSI